MTTAVFDASALLAILFEERGGDRASALLIGGLVSAVNLSEVVAKMSERGAARDRTGAVLRDLGLTAVPFSEADALEAGWLRGATRPVGLSFGDRACLALARRDAGLLVTADRTFAELDFGVAVEVIR